MSVTDDLENPIREKQRRTETEITMAVTVDLENPIKEKQRGTEITMADDLENPISPKDHGIGKRGGSHNQIGAPPMPVTFSVDNELSSQWTSWLVPLFVVANVAVFIVTMFVNNCPKHFESHCVAKFLGRLSFEPLRVNPLFGPSPHTLEKLGALEWSNVVEKKEGWRLLTCIWLHGGVVHLAANMLSLIFIGIRHEQQFGFVRIGVIYLLSGIGGSIMSALFVRNSISVGASGALFGLLGSMLSELFTNWTIYTNKLAALLTFLFVLLINLAIGILPYIDNFAHAGGFLTGFLLGYVLLARPQFKWLTRLHTTQRLPLRYKYKTYQYVLWLLSLVLLIVGFVVALVMLFRGENLNDHCHLCSYLRCLPTSRWSCDDI